MSLEKAAGSRPCSATGLGSVNLGMLAVWAMTGARGVKDYCSPGVGVWISRHPWSMTSVHRAAEFFRGSVHRECLDTMSAAIDTPSFPHARPCEQDVCQREADFVLYGPSGSTAQPYR